MSQQQSDSILMIVLAIVAKLLPAGLGAWIMTRVDPPEDKKEEFTRFFVGLGMSGLFTEVTIDVLHNNFKWAEALDVHNIWHIVAVAGAWGAVGWFVVGALVMQLKKMRSDPVGAMKDIKVLKP
jgi:hypothetical protein